ncbi:MAG: hypothetical protein DRI34_14695 [Deltaproteobacteria bacterium]|nr:MAG: hypothetical protein DRI34_14695 [Deltaproteobacteria bacterium]
MLTSTFRHVKGVGPSRERQLWLAGIRTWDDLLASAASGDPGFLPGIRGLSRKLQQRLAEEIAADRQALRRGDLEFLSTRLARREHWRFYSHFKERAVFLDIETTGTDPGSSRVTVVGVHHPDQDPMVFIDGYNLDDFPGYLEGDRLLVTFNGSSFDLPMLTRHFGALRLPKALIDLRWVAFRAGFKGSLKQIERRVGISRNHDVQGMDGSDAVMLWRNWVVNNDERALELLVGYNISDTMNLRPLLHILLDRIHQREFPWLEHRPFSEDDLVKEAFWVDPRELINRARR